MIVFNCRTLGETCQLLQMNNDFLVPLIKGSIPREEKQSSRNRDDSRKSSLIAALGSAIC